MLTILHSIIHHTYLFLTFTSLSGIFGEQGVEKMHCTKSISRIKEVWLGEDYVRRRYGNEKINGPYVVNALRSCGYESGLCQLRAHG